MFFVNFFGWVMLTVTVSGFAKPAARELACAKVLIAAEPDTDLPRNPASILVKQKFDAPRACAQLEKLGFRRIGQSTFYRYSNIIFEVLPGQGMRVFSERFFLDREGHSVKAKEAVLGVRAGTIPIVLDSSFLDVTAPEFWEGVHGNGPVQQMRSAGFTALKGASDIYFHGIRPERDRVGILIMLEKGTWDRVFVEMWPQTADKLPARFDVVGVNQHLYREEGLQEPHTVVTISDGSQKYLIDSLSAVPRGAVGGSVRPFSSVK